MASLLYVTEYAGLLQAGAPGGQGQVPLEPPLAEQVVNYAAGATASSAFNIKTRLVRLHTDSVCSVLIGTAPTATTASRRMAANQTEYVGVPLTGTFKVSAIINT